MHVAVVFLLVSQGVFADEVVLNRFIGLRGEQGGLCQHFDLQRQQVAEDARQSDDHIDARATEFFQRYQLCADQAAIAVKSRLGTQQTQRLADLAAFGFQVVTAPQHDGDGFGQVVAVFHETRNEFVGLLGPVLHGKRAGNAERVKAVQIAPSGQHVRGAQ